MYESHKLFDYIKLICIIERRNVFRLLCINMEVSARHLTSKLPFIIGITGHRDIYFDAIDDNATALKSTIRATIIHWYNQLHSVVEPNNTSTNLAQTVTPIWLMSGLAEGADLLAIEVAIELQAELGSEAIKIIGCLPMPLVNFEQDFQVNSNGYQQLQKTVSALQNNGNELLEIKHSLTDSDYQIAINDKEYGALRSSLYLNQGLFIAKYTNVLVALWDGCDSKGCGGTADVVKYKLGMEVNWPVNTENASLKAVSEFDGQTAGLVHHLLVKRLNTADFQPQLLLSDNSENNALEHLTPEVGKLYAYCYTGNENALTHFISEEFSKLLSELVFYNGLDSGKHAATPDNMSVPIVDNGLSIANSIFNYADNLALMNQQKYRKLIKLFFWFALVGFVFYELAGNLVNSEEGSWVISVTLFAIMACWGVIRYAGKNELKWKYQLARGIAEGMRIRGFLNLSNIIPSGGPIIPRRYRSHLPLINHAIAVAEIDWWRVSVNTDLNEIRDTWISDQRSFLQSRLQLNAKSLAELLYKRPRYAAMLCSSISKWCFILAISVGTVLLLSMIAQQIFNFSTLNDVNNMLMMTVQYSLMLGGVVALWSELSGYDYAANGYSSMEELYSRAQSLLKGNMTAAQELMLLALAREAMFEHVSWSNSESNNDIKNRH